MKAYKWIIGNQTISTTIKEDIPEGVVYEEFNYIEEGESVEVPQEVQLWRVRTILKLMGLEDDIVTALNSLEEPTKTGALYIWEYGTTVERNSQTVLLLQSVLQLTEEQVNDIFIQANNIQL